MAKSDKSEDSEHNSSENWKDLALVIRNRSDNRIYGNDYLNARGAIVIAGISFLVPSLLNINMPIYIFIPAGILLLASFVLLSVSLFTNVSVPINPDKMIEDLLLDQNMSRKDFHIWVAKSYRDGLKAYNHDYSKKRNEQIWAFALLGVVIFILLIFGGMQFYV